MKDKHPRFIVVDDDPINNMICARIITKTIPDAEVTTFTDAETGLDYIKETFAKQEAGKATLFLDINMPLMTGWEFMEQYKLADEAIKKHLAIYILSSSISPLDRQKARINPDVVDYLEKPLSVAVVESLR